MKVLSVASEFYPLVKTGGLADVAGALPAALSALGVDMRTLLPGYPAVLAAIGDADEVARWPEGRLLATRDLLVFDAPHLYDRPGNPYLDATGRDWPDNAERFAALARVAARIGQGAVDGFVPDVIHAHDWQAALVPAYLRFTSDGRHRPGTVLTLHNLAFQGQFDAAVFDRLGLPAAAFTSDALEYYGDVGFLKAGILLADAVNTVSPTYAREILTPEGGMGMDAMLRWRGSAVSGIVNGIDTDVWNPSTDALLDRTYHIDSLDGRAANKRAVESRFGLPADDAPLLCMITRLTSQKGIDLVVQTLDAIVDAGARMVVLGTGEPAIEAGLRAGAERHPTRVAVRIGYDESLAHRMQGGCDAILVPSRFEPCGLTQLCGLRYGCVPVVTRVGGLADTVDQSTGVVIGDITAAGVLEAIGRLVELHRSSADWQAKQRAGMRSEVGWRASAAAYAALYRRVAAAD